MRHFLRIPMVVILLFLAAVILTFFLLSATNLPHRVADRLLTRYIESRYDLKISFGDLGGSLWRDMRIENLRIDFDLEPNRYRLGKIKSIHLYYNLKRMLTSGIDLDSIVIIEPTVVLRSDTTGKLLIPGMSGGVEGKRAQPKLSSGHLRLVDGKFQWFQRADVLYLDGINTCGVMSMDDDGIKVTVDSLSFSYPDKDFELSHLRLNLAYSHDVIGIDSLELVTGKSRLLGGGVYQLQSEQPFSFKFVNSHLDFAELSRITGITLVGEVDFDASVSGTWERISGEALLDGTLFDRQLGPLNTTYSYSDGVLKFDQLKGEAFDGTLEGSLELDLIARPETYSADLIVRDLNLNKIIPNTFQSAVDADMQLFGSGLGANSFSLDIVFEAPRSNFDFVNYDYMSGMISINVDEMYFHPGFQLGYKNSHFEAEGVVNFTGDMRLEGSFRTTQLADFWGDLFIAELSGGGTAEYLVDGPTEDPDIKGWFKGDSCSFYGLTTDSAYAEFDIESFLYSRFGWTTFRCWQSDVWNIPADSLFAVVDIDSDLVEIRRAELFDEHVYLDMIGDAILYDSTADVAVDSLTFCFDSLTYRNEAPVDVHFLADRIVVDRFALSGEGGLASIACDYGYDSTISLNVQLSSFPFAPWLQVLQVDTMFFGDLDLTFRVEGKLSDPEIVLVGDASDLSYGASYLGRMHGTLDYADSTLIVHQLDFSNDDLSLTVGGDFPLVIDLDSGNVYVPEREIDLRLVSDGDDLSLLSLVLPDLESLSGVYQCTLQVYGTPQRPRSEGSFRLADGSMKVFQMENLIENLEMEIYSRDRQIDVQWIEGTASYKGETGIIRSAGDIYVESIDLFDYDLLFVGFNLPVKYDLGDIFIQTDTLEIEITGSDPPRAFGWVTVRKADYFDEFEEEELLTALEAADTTAVWDYEINVELLPASVNIKNSDVNAVADGELTIIRHDAKDNYIGTLNVVRGKYYLFDLAFKIEEGSRITYDDIEQPNPALDIKVSIRVRTFASGGSASAHDRLELLIGGTLLQPLISAAEGSAYTDADIITLLVLNRPASSNGLVTDASPLESRLQVGATDFVSKVASQALTRQLGVESIEIVPTYNEKNVPEGAIISLGTYLAPSLYTYFSSPLSLQRGTELGFEYRIGRHFFIGGRRDRDNLYHLNLNVGWEFR